MGAVAGAVGGLLTAAIFGGDAGRAAARGAAWGAGTGAVTGAIRGDMAEEAAVARQQRARQQAELERLRAEIGNDNLLGLDALAQCKQRVALAYADTAARSTNREHALAAQWLEALAYADEGNRSRVEPLYPRLVDADSEIHSRSQAETTLWDLVQGLQDVRTQYGLPATCAP